MKTDEEVRKELQANAKERLANIPDEEPKTRKKQLKDGEIPFDEIKLDDEIFIDGEPIIDDIPEELRPKQKMENEENETKKENPNYYANIPAEVRYCNITMGARFMYGEITALCNQKGYCWASNKYFADLYKVSTRTISSWIGELKEKEFITYEVEDNYRRKVYITRHFLGSGKSAS